jgi:hypothetical protein
MDANPASKVDIDSIAEKNMVAGRIAAALDEKSSFLLVGHRSPDEDCIASMVAFGLLASRLNREVSLYLSGAVHEQFSYLLKICGYNAITVLGDDSVLPESVDAVVALDTPKPDMLDLSEGIRSLIGRSSPLRIEIDHHLGADSAYFCERDYALVCSASSACELVGYLALKMDEARRPECEEEGKSLLARNFVLAVLTGIIADSRMGKYLKTPRERLFYERFSSIFDKMLAQKTAAGSGNFASKEEVFSAIARLSSGEEECYRRMMALRGRVGPLEYVILDEKQIAAIHDEYGEETLTTIAKSVADALAEESGKLGLVAYPDHPAVSDLMQFRLRRSHAYRDLDLRDLLPKLDATNGGGHPGAVGFRFPKSESPESFRDFASQIAMRIAGLAP